MTDETQTPSAKGTNFYKENYQINDKRSRMVTYSWSLSDGDV